MAVDRTRVEERAGSGDRGARRVLKLLEQLSFHLSGAQLGITITSLVLGFLAEPAVGELIKPALNGALGSSSDGVSFVLAFVIATVLQMVFGELVPKSLATSSPLVSAKALSRPTVIYAAFAGPVVAFLDGLAGAVTRRLGFEPASEIESTPDREELEQIIKSSGEEGTLDAGEVQLLTRSIRLADKSADDAMVPRVEIESVSCGASVDELARVAVKTGHSRFPVTAGDLDTIVGVVHVKSVHAVEIGRRAETTVEQVMADVLAVPETKDLDELLVELRERGGQLAVVIDEHGGTAGIITLEDILEEIVGEIDDEHDEAPTSLTRVESRGSTIVPASLHHDEILDAVGFEMPDGDFETVAGLILDRLGHIPEPGEMCEVGGWRIEVVAMDRLRIATVRMVQPRETDS